MSCCVQCMPTLTLIRPGIFPVVDRTPPPPGTLLPWVNDVMALGRSVAEIPLAQGHVTRAIRIGRAVAWPSMRAQLYNPTQEGGLQRGRDSSREQRHTSYCVNLAVRSEQSIPCLFPPVCHPGVGSLDPDGGRPSSVPAQRWCIGILEYRPMSPLVSLDSAGLSFVPFSAAICT